MNDEQTVEFTAESGSDLRLTPETLEVKGLLGTKRYRWADAVRAEIVRRPWADLGNWGSYHQHGMRRRLEVEFRGGKVRVELSSDSGLKRFDKPRQVERALRRRLRPYVEVTTAPEPKGARKLVGYFASYAWHLTIALTVVALLYKAALLLHLA